MNARQTALLSFNYVDGKWYTHIQSIDGWIPEQHTAINKATVIMLENLKSFGEWPRHYSIDYFKWMLPHESSNSTISSHPCIYLLPPLPPPFTSHFFFSSNHPHSFFGVDFMILLVSYAVAIAINQLRLFRQHQRKKCVLFCSVFLLECTTMGKKRAYDFENVMRCVHPTHRGSESISTFSRKFDNFQIWFFRPKDLDTFFKDTKQKDWPYVCVYSRVVCVCSLFMLTPLVWIWSRRRRGKTTNHMMPYVKLHRL